METTDPMLALIDAKEIADAKSHLNYYVKIGKQLSQAGLRVGVLLNRWVGLHHVQSDSLRKADWSNERFVEISAKYLSLSTYDFSDLTRLIFLCHDLAIRVEINAKASCVTLMFHPRQREKGSLGCEHPTIEGALLGYRKNHPAPAAPAKLENAPAVTA